MPCTKKHVQLVRTHNSFKYSAWNLDFVIILLNTCVLSLHFKLIFKSDFTCMILLQIYEHVCQNFKLLSYDIFYFAESVFILLYLLYISNYTRKCVLCVLIRQDILFNIDRFDSVCDSWTRVIAIFLLFMKKLTGMNIFVSSLCVVRSYFPVIVVFKMQQDEFYH